MTVNEFHHEVKTQINAYMAQAEPGKSGLVPCFISFLAFALAADIHNHLMLADGAESFIEELPQRYETPLGKWELEEGTVKLSGGQW